MLREMAEADVGLLDPDVCLRSLQGYQANGVGVDDASE
jgi:hypothetical protein